MTEAAPLRSPWRTARVAALAPVTVARIQRRLGSERIADALADAQRGKR